MLRWALQETLEERYGADSDAGWAEKWIQRGLQGTATCPLQIASLLPLDLLTATARCNPELRFYHLTAYV